MDFPASQPKSGNGKTIDFWPAAVQIGLQSVKWIFQPASQPAGRDRKQSGCSPNWLADLKMDFPASHRICSGNWKWILKFRDPRKWQFCEGILKWILKLPMSTNSGAE